MRARACCAVSGLRGASPALGVVLRVEKTVAVVSILVPLAVAIIAANPNIGWDPTRTESSEGTDTIKPSWRLHGPDGRIGRATLAAEWGRTCREGCACTHLRARAPTITEGSLQKESCPSLLINDPPVEADSDVRL